MEDSGKGGLVPPFAGKINENASSRNHRKHGGKKSLKTPAKKPRSANEHEHESPTSVAACFDSPSIQTPPSKKHAAADCYFPRKKIDRRHYSLIRVQTLFREINKANLQSVIINPISTGTSKLLADAAVIMFDIFRKRKLAEKAIGEHCDLLYFGMDALNNKKLCFKRTMEERAYSYGGADMLSRFQRREFPFQYSVVKEFLEKKILRDGFSPLSSRFYNREFPYENSVVKEFLEK